MWMGVGTSHYLALHAGRVKEAGRDTHLVFKDLNMPNKIKRGKASIELDPCFNNPHDLVVCHFRHGLVVQWTIAHDLTRSPHQLRLKQRSFILSPFVQSLQRGWLDRLKVVCEGVRVFVGRIRDSTRTCIPRTQKTRRFVGAGEWWERRFNLPVPGTKGSNVCKIIKVFLPPKDTHGTPSTGLPFRLSDNLFQLGRYTLPYASLISPCFSVNSRNQDTTCSVNAVRCRCRRPGFLKTAARSVYATGRMVLYSGVPNSSVVLIE